MWTGRKVRTGASLLAIAVCGTLFAPTALAQNGPTPAAHDDESNVIIVTARMREETITEAPISITAFSDEQLEARQIDSLQDLASQTPGLGFEQASSATSSRPVIRGMSQLARSSGDIANVGIFVDGIYSSGLSGTDLGFEGVARVEVVRGPQAAQYGRNTFAGAINYITKRPGDVFAAGARASVGEDAQYSFSGYASVPIHETMGVRVDASKGSSGGHFINMANGKRLNKEDSELVRLGVLIKPSADANIFLTGAYNHDATSPSPLAVIPDNSPRRVGKPAGTARSPIQIGRRVSGQIEDYTETFSYDPRAFGSERTSYRLGAISDFNLGPVTLVLRTGYEDRQVRTLVDLDQTPGGTNFGTATAPLFAQTSSGDIENRQEFSQDIRLQASHPTAFDWMVGAYYSDERNLQSDVRFADPALGTGGTTAPLPLNGKARIDQQDRVKNVFKSVYGMIGYKFDFGLNLTAEGRWTSERKRVKTLQNNYGSDRLLPLGDELDATFEYFTPRLIASFTPTRHLNFYVSAAKGTKSGGFNPVATLASEKTFEPEVNWTYEIGAKADLFGMLQVAASVYHIDWTNQQLLTFATGPVSGTDTSITTNIAKSEVDGAEVSFTLTPTKWLALDAAYAYTNARYVDAVTSSFANFVDCAALPKIECVNGVTTGRISGNQLQFSPKHQATFGAEVTVPLAGSLDFYARVDYSLIGKKYVDAGNIGWLPGRDDLRLRIGVQNDRFKLQGYCENVTNSKVPVTAFESRDFNGNPHYYARVREPRRCGASLSYTY